MKLFVVLLTIITSYNALAVGDYANRYWLSKSSSVAGLCETYGNSSYGYKAKYECNELFENKNFSKEALKVCSKHKVSWEIMSCLKIVSNSTFDKKALKKCDAMTNAANVNTCLKTIKNASFNHKSIKSCVNHKSKQRSYSFIYNYTTPDRQLTSCFYENRINIKLDNCKAVSNKFTELFLDPDPLRKTYYNLEHDIIKLLDHVVNESAEGNTDFLHIKVLSSENPYEDLIGRDFFIKAEDAKFSENCYKN